MKKTISLVLILVLGLATVNLAAEETWIRKADMPTARLGLTTSEVNGKIYAIGGYARANSPGMKTVEEYDPGTDTWTVKAGMPTGRRGLSASAVDGKIYVLGGYTNYGQPGLSRIEEYDPATDTWTGKTNMPTARLGVATSVVNGIIYAIGGARSVSQGPLKTVEAYDPQTDTWTTKADMPTARFYLSASVVDGKIYVIGGQYGSGRSYSKVEEYNPATDTWTEKADMPTKRCGFASCVVNGRIYAIGGVDVADIISTTEEYDPATDTWTEKANMPTGRLGLAASVVNEKIYAIGGASTATGGHPGVRTVHEYDPYPLVVDFNGDGIVDCADMCEMVDHWGTDDQLYDIGPMPWGDGIVDVQDLIVLVEHMLEEIPTVEEVNVDEDDDGGQVELEQGQVLVVTLESNPTTGYRWEVVETQESILEQMGEAQFKPSEEGEPPMAGAGGWEIFRFKAISAEQMTLQLVYRRSWEEGVEPINTFSIEVVVN